MLRGTRDFIYANGDFYIIDYKSGSVRKIPSSVIVSDHLKNIRTHDNISEKWLSLRQSVYYQDYSIADAVLKLDELTNAKLHETNNQPPLSIDGFSPDSLIEIPRPIYSIPANDLQRFFALLYWSFGIKEIGSFFKDIVFLKYAPSVGARHGVEAFISVPHEKKGYVIVYYFDPKKNGLFPVTIYKSSLRFVRINLGMRLEAYAWRYNHGGCLFDVYMDTGHILGNLRLISQSIGVAIDENISVTVPLQWEDTEKFLHLISVDTDLLIKGTKNSLYQT